MDSQALTYWNAPRFYLDPADGDPHGGWVACLKISMSGCMFYNENLGFAVGYVYGVVGRPY
jgi:hypothetical protein